MRPRHSREISLMPVAGVVLLLFSVMMSAGPATGSRDDAQARYDNPSFTAHAMHMTDPDNIFGPTALNDWTNKYPSTKPNGRFQHAMAYDSQSSRIVLFGGCYGGNETWAYDFKTNNWTDMKPSSKPVSRLAHAMAYDSQSDRIILFGGVILSGYSSETWAYDFNANTWTNMNPSSRPSGRSDHAMAYDSQSDRVIMFGGRDGSVTYNETWAYDFNSNTWANMNPVVRPSLRQGTAMGYDSQSDRVVMFGGNDETWAYDFNTNTWTNAKPSVGPPSRINGAMAYDVQHDRVILFGGKRTSSGSQLLDDTWAYDYDTNAWTNMSPPSRPSARFQHAMVYDSQNDRIILFGGDMGSSIDDTWWYAYGPIPPSVTATSPVNGSTSVPVGANITITFSEAMNKSATEGAISASPAISGTFLWNAATKVVTWDPSGNLSYSKKYTINISSAAKSQAGANMASPHSFSFTTIPPPDVYPPYVASTNPANSTTNVQVNTKIDVQWNETMNRASAQNAFSSSPTITCGWGWTGLNQTCTPTGYLQPTTQYLITISTAAKDLAGNAMKGPYSFSFTTGHTPPTVVGLDPKDGDTNVLPNTKIIITFDKAMDKAVTEGAISILPAVAWSASWSSGDTTVTFTPSSYLQDFMQYTVTISAQAKSADGANLVATCKFSFKTASKPYVVMTTPMNGTTYVPIDTNIEVRFSEAMDKPSTESAFSSYPSFSGKFSWDATMRWVTWDPDPLLLPNTKYTILVSSAAKSGLGMNMETGRLFFFTTAPPDTTIPRVIQTTPMDNEVEVSIYTEIDIQWTEDMDQTSAEGAFSSTPVVNCTWSWKSYIQICTPDGPLLTSTTYEVTISTAAKDRAGNPMSYNYLFGFKTKIQEATPPKVISTIPADGDTDVPIDRALVITFDRPMDTYTMRNAILTYPKFYFNCYWSSGNTAVSLWVSPWLVKDTIYTVNVTKAARSTAGVFLQNQYSFSFATGSEGDITYPEIVGTDPTNGTSGVGNSSTITITFSEPMYRPVTEGAISISPSVKIIKMEWDATGTRFKMTPERLSEGTAYTVSVSHLKALDLAKHPMNRSYSFTFSTKEKEINWSEVFMGTVLPILIGAVLVVVAAILVALFVKRKWKRCPECKGRILRKELICPNCGYDFIRMSSVPLTFKKDNQPSEPPGKDARGTVPVQNNIVKR